MDKKSQWLLEQLPHWVSTGAIQPAIAEEIRAQFGPALDPAQRSRRRSFAIATAACAMIGIGVIMLVSWNWHEMGRPLKATLAFLLWSLATAGLASALFAVAKERRYLWVEGAATIHALCLGASLAMIALIYPSGGEIRSLLLLWAVLALAQNYLAFSVGSLAVFVGVLIAYLINNHEITRSSGYFWWLLAASLPQLWVVYRREVSRQSVVLMWLLALAIWIGYFIELLESPDGLIALAAAFLFAAYLAGGRLLTSWIFADSPVGWRSRPFEVMGFLGILGTGLYLSVTEVWFGFRLDYLNRNHLAVLLALLALGILMAHAALTLMRRGDRLALLFVAFPIVVFIAALLNNLIPLGSFTASLLMNLYLSGGICLWLIYTGAKQVRLARLNAGVALIALQILIRVAEADFRLYVGAVIFIATGILMLALSRILSNKKEATP